MSIKWYDKIINVELLRHANLLCIKKNLMWLGHVYRMDTDRPPRQLLYSQLCEEYRNQRRPILRFKDVAKRNMKYRKIDIETWQIAANDSRAA